MAEDKFCTFAFASRLTLYMELTHSLVYSVKEKVKRPTRKLPPPIQVWPTATSQQQILRKLFKRACQRRILPFLYDTWFLAIRDLWLTPDRDILILNLTCTDRYIWFMNPQVRDIIECYRDRWWTSIQRLHCTYWSICNCWTGSLVPYLHEL